MNNHIFFIILYKIFFVKSNYVVHTYLFSSHVFVRLHDGSITLEPGQDNHKIPFVEHDFCIPEILFVKLVAFTIEFVTDYPKHHICIWVPRISMKMGLLRQVEQDFSYLIAKLFGLSDEFYKFLLLPYPKIPSFG